jgi:predicted dehydrogenase
MQKDLAGGGSLVDIGIYSLNGIIWFFGESPSAVRADIFATPGDERFAEVENLVMAQLVFPSGRRAQISSGYMAEKKRIDLFGTEAVAVLDPATAYQGNRLTLWRATGREQWKQSEPSAAQFTAEIDHFTQAIRNDSDVKTPGEMGLRDCRIIEALYHSAATGGWVRLNPDMTMKS